MRILEELWYGNIDPTEYGVSPSQEYRELHRLVDRNETDLRATMTNAQQELFNRYLESVQEYQTLRLRLSTAFARSPCLRMLRQLSWRRSRTNWMPTCPVRLRLTAILTSSL